MEIIFDSFRMMVAFYIRNEKRFDEIIESDDEVKKYWVICFQDALKDFLKDGYLKDFNNVYKYMTHLQRHFA